MTVYQLIRKLAEYPPDLEVVAIRFGSKRAMKPHGVHRQRGEDYRGRPNGKPDHVWIGLDWAEEEKAKP